MTAFFIPELGDPGAEETYAAICALAEEDTGFAPHTRRIFRLWSRRAGADCVTEVGRPDPVNGATVLAILDLGRGRPYLVHCGVPGEEATAVREIVGAHVYDVTEFTI
jgi:hypothetical protein